MSRRREGPLLQKRLRKPAHNWILTFIFLSGCGLIGESPSGIQLFDLAGRAIDPLQYQQGRATVFLFTRTDCPISNRYAPEINRLYRKFSSRQIEFRMVYVDPHEPPEEIERHVQDYRYEAPVLLDPDHQLVRLSGAKVTPEAAVFLPSGAMIYRGRIDDWYVDFGKYRSQPVSRELEEVLEAVIAGKKPSLRTAAAVGCFISDLK